MANQFALFDQKFENSLQKFETLMNDNIRNELERLRLGIRNDRLQDRWW